VLGQFRAGVKVLIRDAGRRCLLILSHDRGWEVPGGGVEEGEDLLAALHREVAEEVGIAIKNERLVGVYVNQLAPPALLFWFSAEIAAGDPRVSDEAKEFEWVPEDQITSRIAHPSFRDRVNDVLNFDGRIRYRVFRATSYLKDLAYEVLSEAEL
jgi:8-oxo-dGTP diphosphatase